MKITEKEYETLERLESIVCALESARKDVLQIVEDHLPSSAEASGQSMAFSFGQIDTDSMLRSCGVEVESTGATP